MQLTQSIEQSHSQFSLLVNRIEIIYQSGPREENEIFILFPSLQDGYQWWSNWIIVVSCGQLQKWVDKKKKHNCKAGYIHSCGHGASKDSCLPDIRRGLIFISKVKLVLVLLPLFLWFIDEFHKPVYLSILRTNSYLFLFTSGSFDPIKHFSF